MPDMQTRSTPRAASYSDVATVHNRIFDEIAVGETANIERTLRYQDIELFAVLSGDVTPQHLDADDAESTRFQGVIAHGMLAGAPDARTAGLIEPVLVGPRARIEAAAQEHQLDISGIPIEDAPHSHATAARAVQVVLEGKVQALMKGSLHTDELMVAVIASQGGQRTKRRVSHCYPMQPPAYARPFIITDAAINAATAGIVLGARVPIVLTSRADARDSRLASCAVAVLLAHHYQKAPL